MRGYSRVGSLWDRCCGFPCLRRDIALAFILASPGELRRNGRLSSFSSLSSSSPPAAALQPDRLLLKRSGHPKLTTERGPPAKCGPGSGGSCCALREATVAQRGAPGRTLGARCQSGCAPPFVEVREGVGGRESGSSFRCFHTIPQRRSRRRRRGGEGGTRVFLAVSLREPASAVRTPAGPRPVPHEPGDSSVGARGGKNGSGRCPPQRARCLRVVCARPLAL